MDWLEELRERETLDEVRDECDRTVRKIRSLYRACRHRERDLINEINWLHAELHGAEQRAERKPRKTCHRERDEHRGLAKLYRHGEMETYGLSKCSACGAVTLISSYCPDCGAKVVG